MFWSLCTNRRGAPENFVNLIFHLIFYTGLCRSLFISHVPVVICIKRFFFLQILQNSKKTFKHQAFFLTRLQRFNLQFFKRETPTQMFSCESYKVYKNIYFTHHFWVTTSVFCIFLKFV